MLSDADAAMRSYEKQLSSVFLGLRLEDDDGEDH
jgi:hypothetical protein